MTGRPTLMRASLFQNSRDGAPENLDVQRQAAPLDVSDVQPQAVVEFRLAAPEELPQAGDARDDVQPLGLPQAVGLGRERGRPRADEAHLAVEHVADLR